MQNNDDRTHNLMLAIFSVASGMIGVCLTGIGLLQVLSSMRSLGTLADEMLAVDAVIFLGCAISAFLSFRGTDEKRQHRFRKAADSLLFIGLLLMVIICAIISLALF